MSTWVYYVDESYDRAKFCLVAIGLRDRDWQLAFTEVKEFRRQLKTDYGILLRKELHATNLVSGRGRLGPDIVTKRQRNVIFRRILQCVTQLPSAQLFSICLDSQGANTQMRAWDRLTNRIERTMRYFEEGEQTAREAMIAKCKDIGLHGELLESVRIRLLAYKPRALIVADEGREKEITAAIRRMRVYNPMPSAYGEWEPGVLTKNIVTERIIEDPVFKPSHRSYFLQLADCAAFALLKRESPNRTPLVERFRLDKAFEETLSGICYRRASRDDPLGIVRK